MRLTAVRSVSTFGVGLALAAGLGQGDTRLPPTQAPTLHLPAPKLRALPLPRLVIPRAPSLNAPGDVMPHSYMVYGLRTSGPGGMACTDRNGAAIPMPFSLQIILKPFNGMPPVTPAVTPPAYTILPTSTTPRLYIYNDSLPAPKK